MKRKRLKVPGGIAKRLHKRVKEGGVRMDEMAEAADTIDELVAVLALCRGDHFPAGFNRRIAAALRRATGEE